MHSRLKRLLWPALAVLVAGAAIVHPLPFFLDDALFYPQIAFHIVRDGQSTFSGIGPTNGYHPLWMLFNIATMWTARLNKVLNLRLLVAVEVGLLALALFHANRLMERLELRHRAVGLSLLILTLCTGLFGLEAHLSFLMIVLWENLLLNCLDRDARRDWVLFGIFCALTGLARLDNVFLIGSGMLFASGSLRRLVSKEMVAGAIALALISPYLLLNEMLFGHFVPISGSIKSGFPHAGFNPAYLGFFGECMAIGAIVGLAVSFSTYANERVGLLLRVNSLGTLLHAAYVVFFSIDPSTRFFWYYTVGIVNWALLVNVLLSVLETKAFPRMEASLALASALIVLAASGRAWLKAYGININPLNPTWVARADPASPGFQFMLAGWMARNLPRGSRVLAADFPGTLAYQSECDVIALDGLTNDFSYDTELSQSGIVEFAARHGVGYYFGPTAFPGESIKYGQTATEGVSDSQKVTVFSPLSRKPAGVLEMDRRRMLIDASNEFGGTGHGHLALWMIRTPSSHSRDMVTQPGSTPPATK